ncbi:hypothetical protein, partial [Aeromonas sanarellii]|uniref:hypothetical protein n=1 Tax=Aeromonas sanarellii TaxID=633415 RepID=UPI0039857F96
EEDGGDQITKYSVSSIQAASIWETTPVLAEQATRVVGGNAKGIATLIVLAHIVVQQTTGPCADLWCLSGFNNSPDRSSRGCRLCGFSHNEIPSEGIT